MAEEKLKGNPVILEIPTTGETITLPGVTSLNSNDELKAAADAWIAKNYKGPLLTPINIERAPAVPFDQVQGAAPTEEIRVTANRQPELKAYTPATITGGAYDALQSGFATLADFIPGFDERRANDYASNILRNIKTGTEGLLGVEETERSARDIAAGRATLEDYFNVGLLTLPFAAKPVAAAFRRVAPETSAAAVPKATLTPEMAAVATPVAPAPVVPRTRMSEEQGVAGIEALGGKGQTRPIATQEVTDKVLRFETDYLKETGLSRPEKLPLKDFFFMHFNAGTLPMERTLELAKQAGIDPSDLTDFVAGSQQTATEAARILRARMVMSKYIPKEAADVAEAGVKTPDELSLWKRTTDATRGLMVSQLATTMRNTWGSVVRLPIDMATSLTSTAINAATNPFRNDKVGTSALDAFAVITDRFQPARNKQFYEQLRTYYPKVVKDLNATYAADIAGGVAKDKFGKVEKVVNTLNLVNRVTETTTRNMMFPVYLRRELTRRNLNIDDIVDTQRLDEIPQDAIDAALRETMDFTYGAAPKTDHVMGKVADGFIRTVEALGPAGVTIAPFPRFMVSAIRFQAEYNPLGVARLLSKKNRDAMMAGDPEVLSKAIVGSGLFGAAYLFRDSDAAGEKWSEAKLPDGRVIDMKAYFPVPQYLFVADIIKRYNDGKLNGQTLDQAINAKEILQTFTGSQFRAGTGLYVVDEFIKDFTDAGSDPKKALDIVGKFAADYGAAIFTPMQTLKDFYAQYNPEEAIYRDTKGSFLGTLTRSIPGAQRALDIPEGESPTREGPMTTEDPALRQLLGVTIRPAKNIVESELDRLGIAPYKMGSNSGDVDTDRLVNRDLGIIAERKIAPLLRSAKYQSLDNVGKSAAIKDMYAKARETASAKFTAENPELTLLKRYKSMKREERIVVGQRVQAKTGMSAPELLRQLSKAPLMKSQEQYDALPDGAKFTDPGDYKVYTKGE